MIRLLSPELANGNETKGLLTPQTITYSELSEIDRAFEPDPPTDEFSTELSQPFFLDDPNFRLAYRVFNRGETHGQYNVGLAPKINTDGQTHTLILSGWGSSIKTVGGLMNLSAYSQMLDGFTHVDMPGYGNSVAKKPYGKWGFNEISQGIADIIDGMNIPKLNIVASSKGVFVGVMLAKMLQERVEKLAIFGGLGIGGAMKHHAGKALKEVGNGAIFYKDAAFKSFQSSSDASEEILSGKMPEMFWPSKLHYTTKYGRMMARTSLWLPEFVSSPATDIYDFVGSYDRFARHEEHRLELERREENVPGKNHLYILEECSHMSGVSRNVAVPLLGRFVLNQ